MLGHSLEKADCTSRVACVGPTQRVSISAPGPWTCLSKRKV